MLNEALTGTLDQVPNQAPNQVLKSTRRTQSAPVDAVNAVNATFSVKIIPVVQLIVYSWIRREAC